ncbi:hypothetical protein F5I97DRAFT_1827665 [Phlebopus sp. FC_14]|nr:hypothetical protein F5I97DRAFT_1827665 [Phlebopus sp. FC_14]
MTQEDLMGNLLVAAFSPYIPYKCLHENQACIKHSHGIEENHNIRETCVEWKEKHRREENMCCHIKMVRHKAMRASYKKLFADWLEKDAIVKQQIAVTILNYNTILSLITLNIKLNQKSITPNELMSLILDEYDYFIIQDGGRSKPKDHDVVFIAESSKRGSKKFKGIRHNCG